MNSTIYKPRAQIKKALKSGRNLTQVQRVQEVFAIEKKVGEVMFLYLALVCSLFRTTSTKEREEVAVTILLVVVFIDK